MATKCSDPSCNLAFALLSGDGVKCFGCNSVYHFQCAGVAEATHKRKSSKTKEKWRCSQNCRLDKKSITTDDDEDENENAGELALAAIKDPDLKIIFSCLLQKISNVESSAKFMSDKYDDLLNKNMQLEENLKLLKKEKDEEIKNLKSKINEMNQYERRYNVEIFGLEVADGEDVYKLATKTIQKHIPNFEEGDIDYAHRLPSFNKARPPSIIAVLFSRRQKMTLMAAIKKNKKRIAQKEISPRCRNPENEVYVTENISGYYKKLLWMAKQKAALNNYKFVWFQNGRVNVRKADGVKKIIFIQDEKDLDLII